MPKPQMVLKPPPPRPGPRLGPRPLALHMAMEGWILQMSFAGLMSSNAAWSSLKLPESLLGPLRALLAETADEGLPNSPSLKGAPDVASWTAALDPKPFIDAIARQTHNRMETFVRGVRAYQAHAHTRVLAAPSSIWRWGAANLIDYGGPATGAPVLFVPSLINRAYILDLAEDRSLLRSAAASGLKTFLLDWGEPGDAERAFTIDDYIDGVLIPALEDIKARTGQVPKVVGYCLGGTLSVASAVLRPDLVSGLVLLAAPWDFHDVAATSRAFLEMAQPMVEVMLGAQGCLPVDAIQMMFASLDPTLVGRKFRSFANLDPQSEQARRFVEMEDWLNDGIPLAAPVAEEVLLHWYGRNDPAAGRWKVGEAVIDPGRIGCPTLAFIPTQDRIVPPDSAGRLARAILGAKTVTVDLGHIGMVAGAGAPRHVYAPVLAWLNNLARP